MFQQNQNPPLQSIEGKITEIYSALLPPVHFRSAIEFYNEQKEMKNDCKNYYFSDYNIDNFQYELTHNPQRSKKENNQQVFYFEIKPLLPKSQLSEFTAYVKSQYGCKILKTKASNTILELHLEFMDNKKDGKVPIQVFLGCVQGKFKVRLSEYVPLELN